MKLIMKAKYLFSGLAALLLAAGCTEEDWTVGFNGGIEDPQWAKVAAVPATAPTDWVKPDMNIYSASMTAVVRMSDYIQPSIGANDQFAAFIGTECRGVGQQITSAAGETVYLIQVKGDPSETDAVTFRYYCDATKELFYTTDEVAFESDAQLGNVETPQALAWKSESDLPYYMDFDVTMDLSAFTLEPVTANDQVAAFVGDECRGLAMATDEEGNYVFRLRAWARAENEQFTLKYFSAALKNVYVYGTQYPLKHAGKETVAMGLDRRGNVVALEKPANVVDNKQNED